MRRPYRLVLIMFLATSLAIDPVSAANWLRGGRGCQPSYSYGGGYGCGGGYGYAGGSSYGYGGCSPCYDPCYQSRPSYGYGGYGGGRIVTDSCGCSEGEVVYSDGGAPSVEGGAPTPPTPPAPPSRSQVNKPADANEPAPALGNEEMIPPAPPAENSVIGRPAPGDMPPPPANNQPPVAEPGSPPVQPDPAVDQPAPPVAQPAEEGFMFDDEPAATQPAAPATDEPATEAGGLFDEPAPATEESGGLFDEPAPATEEPAPAADDPPAPATDQPADEGLFGGPAPATEEPAGADLFGVPGADEPATEEPALEVPATEEPTPATEEPATDDLFGGATPAADEPAATEVPATEEQPAADVESLFDTPADTEEAAPAATEEPADEENLFGQSLLEVPGGLQSLALRKWTDNTGTYSVDARLLAVSGVNVKLMKSTGRTTTVALSRLSQSDLDFVNRQAAALKIESSLQTAQR